ncbi:MAG: InlB B-repeat-containing protein, partial [Treponema sp.]|nr:InlB B-repeat-containing protein [Treponema sp.]
MKKFILFFIAALIVAGCDNPAGVGQDSPYTGAGLDVLPGNRCLSVSWTGISSVEEILAGNSNEMPSNGYGSGTVIIDGDSAMISGLQNNTAYNVWVRGSGGEIAKTPQKTIPVDIGIPAGRFSGEEHIYELDGVTYSKYRNNSSQDVTADDLIFAGTIVYTDSDGVMVIKITKKGPDFPKAIGTYHALQVVYESRICKVKESTELPVVGYYDGNVIDLNAVKADLAEKMETTANIVGFLVTFDKNGGRTDASPKAVAVAGGAIKTLPIPPSLAMDDFLFAGWNTQENGKGTVFDESTPVDDDLKVYARWRATDGGSDTPLISLSDAADLAKIGGGDPSYPANGNYTLLNDITLTNWIPVCPDGENAFSGTFDGGGHTITLQSFAGSALSNSYVGIFGYVKGPSPQAKAGIRNMKIVSLVTAASAGPYGHGVGLIAGGAENTVIRDITLEGSFNLITAQVVYSGGIAGTIRSGGAVRNCSSSMNILVDGGGGSGGYSHAGGFVGLFTGGGEIHDCHNTGIVTADCKTARSQAFVGGIAGGSSYGFSTAYEGNIQDCSSTGNITAKALGDWSWAGGIAGTIVGDGDGTLEKTTRIVRCWASGTVSVADTGAGWPYVGGIVGYNYYGALVSQCYFTGTVISNGGYDYAGGIAGYNSKEYNGHSSRIEDCWASGTVTGYRNAGGIVGQNQVAAIIQRCYSLAALSVLVGTGATGAYSQVGMGGIAGYNAVFDGKAAGTVRNCVALNPSLTAPNGFDRVY